MIIISSERAARARRAPLCWWISRQYAQLLLFARCAAWQRADYFIDASQQDYFPSLLASFSRMRAPLRALIFSIRMRRYAACCMRVAGKARSSACTPMILMIFRAMPLFFDFRRYFRARFAHKSSKILFSLCAYAARDICYAIMFILIIDFIDFSCVAQRARWAWRYADYARYLPLFILIAAVQVGKEAKAK